MLYANADGYTWYGSLGAHNAVADQLVSEVCGFNLLMGFIGQDCKREVALGSGNRADMVNFDTHQIFEVKPDKPRAIAAGYRQIDRYVVGANDRYRFDGSWEAGEPFDPFQVDYRGHTLNVRYAGHGVAAYSPDCHPDCGEDFDIDRRTLLNNIKTTVKVLLWVPAELLQEVPVPV